MIFNILIAIGAFVIVSLCIIGWHLWIAPDGYEDENGFHYGKPPPEKRGRFDR